MCFTRFINGYSMRLEFVRRNEKSGSFYLTESCFLEIKLSFLVFKSNLGILEVKWLCYNYYFFIYYYFLQGTLTHAPCTLPMYQTSWTTAGGKMIVLIVLLSVSQNLLFRATSSQKTVFRIYCSQDKKQYDKFFTHFLLWVTFLCILMDSVSGNQYQ